MTTEDATAGGGAGLPTSGDIKTLSGRFEAVDAAVRKEWIWIRVLALVIIALGAWIVVQQFALNARTAQAARQDQQIAQLAHQNAANEAAAARKARLLCLKLNSSRAVIVGVWEKVRFVPGADSSVELAKVKAAEPLGKCQ